MESTSAGWSAWTRRGTPSGISRANCPKEIKASRDAKSKGLEKVVNAAKEKLQDAIDAFHLKFGGTVDQITTARMRAIGAKKFDKPQTREQLAVGVNKVHRDAETDRNGPYHVNCQRCVNAYVARARGYDVEAGPAPKIDPYHLSRGKRCVDDVYAEAKCEKISASSSSCIEKKMRQYMSKQGNGAIAIVRVGWRGKKRSGHVFIAEQVDNKTVFLDPQTGRIGVERYFKLAKVRGRFSPWIARVDNLKFTGLIGECAKPR